MKIGISALNKMDSRISRIELIEKLKDKGFEIAYLGLSKKGAKIHRDYTRYGITFIPVPIKRVNTNPIKELKSIVGTCNALKTNKITHLIIYGIRTFPTMVIAAKLSGVKKVICIVNGSGRLFEIKGLRGLILRTLSYPMLFLSFILSDHIFFQNIDNLELLKNKKLLAKNNYSLINGSGVNLERFSVVPLVLDPVFMFIGRITGDKGVNEYIKAAEKVKKIYPSAKFYLIGPIENENISVDIINLEKAVREKIIIHYGPVTDVRDSLSKARIFVLPSYHEGIPRTVLEAMAMGRPIITTEVPGCRETVEEGVNGFRVPKKNVGALVDKMIWMIENPKEVNVMGIESRKICERKFNIHSVNEKIIKKII